MTKLYEQFDMTYFIKFNSIKIKLGEDGVFTLITSFMHWYNQ